MTIAKELEIEHLLNKLLFRLNISEKGKAALMSILAHNPVVLILDEPTANLNYETIQLISDTMFKVKDGEKL